MKASSEAAARAWFELLAHTLLQLVDDSPSPTPPTVEPTAEPVVTRHR